MTKNTIGHLATADNRVISNNAGEGLRADGAVEMAARGASVLMDGESYTVEIGTDDWWSRLAFFNEWFDLTGQRIERTHTAV